MSLSLTPQSGGGDGEICFSWNLHEQKSGKTENYFS